LIQYEGLGRSRGGLTSKIHLLADSGCRPLARVTSAGQRHDSLAFIPLMSQLKITRHGRGRSRIRPGRVLGDKAYSSAAIRAHLRSRGIKATIPEPADQVKNRLKRGSRGGRPPAFDAAAYKQRLGYLLNRSEVGSCSWRSPVLQGRLAAGRSRLGG
jgi:Transposase DDE domain